MTNPIEPTKDGVVLHVVVQPNAGQTSYVGLHGDALKFQIAAPPVDGAANDVLCAFVAKQLGRPKRAVVVGAGQTGRRKRLVVKGVSVRQVEGIFPV